MNNKTCFVGAGIDVSSEKLDIFLMNQQEKGMHKTFENTKKGMESMISFLKKYSFSEKIVMESTGRYHELCAITLFAEGYRVFVINPLRAKKYHIASIKKLKTDKNDARILAEMAMKEKTLDAFTLSKQQISTKKKFGLIRSLEKKLQQLSAMIKDYESSQDILETELSAIEISLKEEIKKIGKIKDKLEDEAIHAVFSKTDTAARKAREILCSVPGISEYYAALVYFFYSLQVGTNIQSWVSYTGMEVSIAQSGKWKGKGKLSKRGNKYLRKRNHGASWGATMNYEHFRSYYDYLKQDKQRGHTEALVILGRRILRIAYSCLKNNQEFDEKIFLLSLPESCQKNVS